jgi:hypothetical protein
MIENRIRDVASRIHAAHAMTERDVALIMDLTLPGGVISRAEAAELVRLERHVTRRHENWSRFFIESLCAHLVWESRPLAVVTAQDAHWLIVRLGLESTGHTPNSVALIETMIAEGAALDPRLVQALQPRWKLAA